jgi:hypothetical protein
LILNWATFARLIKEPGNENRIDHRNIILSGNLVNVATHRIHFRISPFTVDEISILTLLKLLTCGGLPLDPFFHQAHYWLGKSVPLAASDRRCAKIQTFKVLLSM